MTHVISHTVLPDAVLEAVPALLYEVAEKEILPRFNCLTAGEIREKGPGDFVTVADEAAEKFLSAELLRLLPGSAVVGEEAVSADPAVLDRIGEDRPVWIIDPIDGTYNFSHGIERFGTLLALTSGGQTVAGWLFDAPAKTLVMTAKGAGTHLLDSGTGKPARRLVINTGEKNQGLAAPLAGMAGSDYYRKDNALPHLQMLKRHGITAKSLRASLHDHLRLLLGQSQFSLYKGTQPWDHAAGVLATFEAGGQAGFIDGTPYSPALRGKQGLLLAANSGIWQKIAGILAAA